MLNLMTSPKKETFPLIAGTLFKMVTLPFGRSRWVSRYFVLLDSELRFYKDEHSESASEILNLRQIHQVIPAPTQQHPFCFRLEPKQDTAHKRPWIIKCKSKNDMTLWLDGFQSRINRYTQDPMPPSPESLCSSPAWSEKDSVKSVLATSPDLYRVPALSLRCTNPEKKSLLSRRNKSLSPIITCFAQEDEQVCAPSSTGAVLGLNLISPSIINKYSQYQPKTIAHRHVSVENSSPTYLMYKKRFHL